MGNAGEGTCFESGLPLLVSGISAMFVCYFTYIYGYIVTVLLTDFSPCSDLHVFLFQSTVRRR